MEKGFEDLKRRISVTTSNRFNASERLKRHNQFSLFTVIAFSLGLILVSITITLNIDVAVNRVVLSASSIFFSVVILTISTALSMSNFGLRGEKHHDCGRELHALLLDIEKSVLNNDLQSPDSYSNYQAKYEQILARYENHTKVDHLFTKFARSEDYPKKWYRGPIAYGRLWLEYSIYAILLIVEIVWLVIIYTPFSHA